MGNTRGSWWCGVTILEYWWSSINTYYNTRRIGYINQEFIKEEEIDIEINILHFINFESIIDFDRRSNAKNKYDKSLSIETIPK